MSKLDDLEAAIARCDNLDWRIDYDEETEEWYAWFHPDWEADPRRVIRVVLADDEPSANEQACIQAMQLVMANAPAMMQVARAAYNEKRLRRTAPMRDWEAAVKESDTAIDAISQS